MMEWLTQISIEQAAALTAIIGGAAKFGHTVFKYFRKPAPRRPTLDTPPLTAKPPRLTAAPPRLTAEAPRLIIEVQSQPALRWRGWFLLTLTIRNTQGSTVDLVSLEAVGHPKDLIQRAVYERPILLGDPSGVVWPDKPPSFTPQRTVLGLPLRADQTAKPLRLYIFVGPAITGSAIQRSIWLYWKSRTSAGEPVRQRIDF